MNKATLSRSFYLSLCLAVLSAYSLQISAQQADASAPKVLAGAEASKLIPASFYFEGQSAPVQLRNSAAARIANKHVMAGLVDTSGYAATTRAKCQGFLTSELPVQINGSEVRAGSYGIGFAEGKMNIYDLGGSLITSVTAATDSAMRRPRPLMMVKAADGVRLYVGREYVVINGK